MCMKRRKSKTDFRFLMKQWCFLARLRSLRGQLAALDKAAIFYNHNYLQKTIANALFWCKCDGTEIVRWIQLPFCFEVIKSSSV